LPVDELPFVETVERLGEAVVVAVALGPDRRDDVVRGEPLRVADAEVLDAAVAVVHHARDVMSVALTVPHGHLQGVECEVRAQRLGGLPAHDHPGEHVDHERDVDPPGVGAHVGDVGDPQPVRCRRSEAAFDQIAPVGPCSTRLPSDWSHKVKRPSFERM